MSLPLENIYGHIGRVDWIERFLRPGDRVIDLGCGTGYMVTYPLLIRGHDVSGVDVDDLSIEYGRRAYRSVGLDPDRLLAGDLAAVEGPIDVIVISEVLEHLEDDERDRLLALAYGTLSRGGRVLITVPSGRGWYEREAAVWRRMHIEGLLKRPRLNRLVYGVRHRMLRGYIDAAHPSTLSSTPHVQRYTLQSLQDAVSAAGFRVVAHRGSTLISGPFSHMAFTGARRLMRLNGQFAERWPAISAGFYVAAEKPAG